MFLCSLIYSPHASTHPGWAITAELTTTPPHPPPPTQLLNQPPDSNLLLPSIVPSILHCLLRNLQFKSKLLIQSHETICNSLTASLSPQWTCVFPPLQSASLFCPQYTFLSAVSHNTADGGWPNLPLHLPRPTWSWNLAQNLTAPCSLS